MDYGELVLEVGARTGSPNVPQRADYLVRAAEREINRTLRVGQMEKAISIPTGLSQMPTDLLQARVPNADDAPGTLRYYAALPSVVEGGTNWLLTEDPEIYVAATMAQVYIVDGEVEKAQAARAYLAGLIGAMQRADSARRYSTRPVKLTRLAPHLGRRRWT